LREDIIEEEIKVEPVSGQNEEGGPLLLDPIKKEDGKLKKML
jgi:hypothetical protein